MLYDHTCTHTHAYTQRHTERHAHTHTHRQRDKTDTPHARTDARTHKPTYTAVKILTSLYIDGSNAVKRKDKLFHTGTKRFLCTHSCVPKYGQQRIHIVVLPYFFTQTHTDTDTDTQTHTRTHTQTHAIPLSLTDTFSHTHALTSCLSTRPSLTC